MLDGDYETMIAVSDVRIECLYKRKAINFDQKAQTPPSQLLEPIKSYACSLMGWDVSRFKENIDKFNSAYHGGDGLIGLYELKGYSTIDIGKYYLILPGDKIEKFSKYFQKKFKVKKVEERFSYNSLDNKFFLTVGEIRKLIIENVDPNFKPI